MTTIRDVAKEAGVSIATVSRVMNGTAKVNDDKRALVNKAIEKLKFCPNEVARTLFKKSSQTLGLILPSIMNPFFNRLADAVERIANDNGYKLILCNTHGDAETEAEHLESLTLRQVDGFVVVSDSDVVDKYVEEYNVNVVVLDRYVAHNEKYKLKYPIVSVDNYEGGYIAGRHLIDCGCMKVAHIGMPQGSMTGELRGAGFSDAIKEEDKDLLIIKCAYNYEEGLKAANRLFDEYPRVDGVFAGNDLIAFAVITAAAVRKINIPNDLQIIGFDDILFSQLVTPALTTIAQSMDQLGELATELLIKKIEGEEVPSVVNLLPAKLIVRETTI